MPRTRDVGQMWTIGHCAANMSVTEFKIRKMVGRGEFPGPTHCVAGKSLWDPHVVKVFIETGGVVGIKDEEGMLLK